MMNALLMKVLRRIQEARIYILEKGFLVYHDGVHFVTVNADPICGDESA
jgi:hypothetical protein